MKALLMLAIGLGAAGIVPAVALARRSPVVGFLAPLIGAGMAAVAAGIELGAGGSVAADYMAVVVTVNLVAIGWWLAALRTAQPPVISTRAPRAPRVSWVWASLTLVIVLGCLAVPLMALRA